MQQQNLDTSKTKYAQFYYYNQDNLDMDEEIPKENQQESTEDNEKIQDKLKQQLNVSCMYQEVYQNRNKINRNTFKSPLDQYQGKDEFVIQIDDQMHINSVINEQLVREFGKARCICYSEDRIYIGSNLGQILIIKEMNHQIINNYQKIQASISSMDFKRNVLIVCYESEAMKIVKTIREVHLNRILYCKLVFKNIIMTFDDQGRSKIVRFKPSVLGLDYEFQLLLPDQVYPIVNSVIISKQHRKRMIALVNIQQVWICNLNKDIDRKLEIVFNAHFSLSTTFNPQYVALNCGHGQIPQLQNRFENKQQLLFISWYTNLYILIIAKQDQDIYQMKPLVFGEDPILYHTYTTNNLLMVITQQQKIYLISTKDLKLHITPKDISQIEHHQFNCKWSQKILTSIYCSKVQDMPRLKAQSLSSSVRTLTQDISLQRNSTQDFIFEPYPFQHFSFAKISGNEIYTLCDKQIIKIHLNSWQEAIDQLIKNGDWCNAMWLIIKVQNKEQKYYMEDEESIIHKIKTLTTQYLNIIIKQMKNILDEHGTLTHISSRIVQSTLSLLIDFLSRTQPQLLFNQIFNIMCGFLKGDIQIYCKELQPYIDNYKFKNLDIQSDVINQIINCYYQQKSINTINAFFQQINLVNIETQSIIEICFSFQLVQTLIYVCTNTNQNDLNFALGQLWIMTFKAYQDRNYNQAWYYGLGILNYVNSIIQNNRDIDQIRSHLYHSDTIIKLLSFDLKGTIKIFTPLVFQSKQLYSLIIDVLQNINTPDDEFIQKMLEIQIQKQKIQQWQQFVELIKLSFKLILIQYQENVDTLLLDVLSKPQCLDHLPLSILPLPTLLKDNQDLDLIKQYAYNQFLVQIIVNHGPINKIQELIEKASDFSLVLIELTQIQESRLIRVLDLKIFAYNKFENLRIKEHEEIFDWIESIIRNRKIDTELQQIFQNRVLDHLSSLVEISPLRTRNLINGYLNRSDLSILDKIDDYPRLQLDYLQHLLQNNQKVDNDLFKLYIKLLCQFSPSQVIQDLKNHDYPLDEIMEICQKYKVNQAIAYLYERSGDIKKSIQKRFEDIHQNPELLKIQFKEIIKLCQNITNSEESNDIWIVFASQLLQMEDIDQYQNEFFIKWSESTYIPLFIESISYYFNNIKAVYLADTFQSQYQNLRFLENLYQISKDIIWIHIVYQTTWIESKIQKGNFLLSACYQCRNRITKYDEHELIIVLNCGHIFHLRCIQEKNKSNYKCPLCLDDPKEMMLQLLSEVKQKKNMLQRGQSIRQMTTNQLPILGETLPINDNAYKCQKKQKLNKFDLKRIKFQDDLFEKIDQYELNEL